MSYCLTARDETIAFVQITGQYEFIRWMKISVISWYILNINIFIKINNDDKYTKDECTIMFNLVYTYNLLKKKCTAFKNYFLEFSYQIMFSRMTFLRYVMIVYVIKS